MEAETDHFLVRAMTTEDSGYRYAVNEWPDADGPKSVRDAFLRERETLLEKLHHLNAILDSDRPEKAELLMSANPDFKVWQVGVPAPQTDRTFDFDKMAELIFVKKKKNPKKKP